MRLHHLVLPLGLTLAFSGCDPEATIDDDDAGDDDTSGPVDADQDGYTDTTDCDDSDPLTFPGATELCDGLDNDCDDVVPDDELDGDGDGMPTCEGDCDDTDETVYEGAEEACDGLDNDCDEEVPSDETDDDGDGVSECEGDCNDEDEAIYPEAAEACNAIDDDCDTEVDEDFDADADTYTTCGADGVSGTEDDDCDDNDAVLNLDDADADSFTSCGGDCDDAEGTINPDAEEACNGLDDDCDGAVPGDEVDSDGDTYLACEDCNDDDAVLNYDDADLDGYSTCAGDCSDADASLNPADADGDGFSTCQGDCDDADADLNLSDADSDGWDTCEGDCDDTDATLDIGDDDGDGVTSCDGDCDDDNADSYPSATEICDGLDNNCNGSLPTEESDSDNDGYMVCEDDCDDLDAGTNPGEFDTCLDGADNDCNGVVDDCCMAVEVDGSTSYVDLGHDADLNLASGSFTAEAWAYLDAYTSYNVSPILSKMSNDGGTSHGWTIWIAGPTNVAGYTPGNPVVNVRQADGQSQSVADTGTVIPTGQWFHIAATYDANTSTMTLWVDGTSIATGSCSPPSSTNHVSLFAGLFRPIADCGGSCRFTDGVIDEVRLSSTVRYITDFTPEIYLSPDADTIALWHFNEGVGGTMYDESGNGYDGTGVGTSWVEDCP